MTADINAARSRTSRRTRFQKSFSVVSKAFAPVCCRCCFDGLHVVECIAMMVGKNICPASGTPHLLRSLTKAPGLPMPQKAKKGPSPISSAVRNRVSSLRARNPNKSRGGSENRELGESLNGFLCTSDVFSASKDHNVRAGEGRGWLAHRSGWKQRLAANGP